MWACNINIVLVHSSTNKNNSRIKQVYPFNMTKGVDAFIQSDLGPDETLQI